VGVVPCAGGVVCGEEDNGEDGGRREDGFGHGWGSGLKWLVMRVWSESGSDVSGTSKSLVFPL